MPNPVPENEKVPSILNPIPYPEYLYLSILEFLVKLTAPNKRFSSVGSLLLVLSFLFISKNNVNVYYSSVIVCNFLML